MELYKWTSLQIRLYSYYLGIKGVLVPKKVCPVIKIQVLGNRNLSKRGIKIWTQVKKRLRLVALPKITSEKLLLTSV